MSKREINYPEWLEVHKLENSTENWDTFQKLKREWLLDKKSPEMVTITSFGLTGRIFLIFALFTATLFAMPLMPWSSVKAVVIVVLIGEGIWLALAIYFKIWRA